MVETDKKNLTQFKPLLNSVSSIHIYLKQILLYLHTSANYSKRYKLVLFSLHTYITTLLLTLFQCYCYLFFSINIRTVKCFLYETFSLLVKN